MYISGEEVAVIYARACWAWYGKRAHLIVTEQIRRFKRSGDASGVEAWSQVAAKLRELQLTVCSKATAIEHGKLYR
jgi:hypothetical protein